MPSKPSHITDYLANERTFLAWLRTLMSMMGFGVVIVRLRELSPDAALVYGRLHAIQLGVFRRHRAGDDAFCAMELDAHAPRHRR